MQPVTAKQCFFAVSLDKLILSFAEALAAFELSK
jgi:hypothetical protein